MDGSLDKLKLDVYRGRCYVEVSLGTSIFHLGNMLGVFVSGRRIVVDNGEVELGEEVKLFANNKPLGLLPQNVLRVTDGEGLILYRRD